MGLDKMEFGKNQPRTTEPRVNQPRSKTPVKPLAESTDFPGSLQKYGIQVKHILRNANPAILYEEALRSDGNSILTNTGALVAYSGQKTGRSPKDKRIVENAASRENIWWGDVNIKMDEHSFLINRDRAIDYLNTKPQLFVVDGFAGWDPKYRIRVRVVCSRPYHALFMHNMLIRPTAEELLHFGEPDYVIFNAGSFPCNQLTSYMTSKTSVDLCFERREMVILGTDYAGEMKKGVFTIMNYLMPLRGVLSMHCSANEGDKGDLTLFFGLSGTGKTTLSADPQRKLIGDDEHCWTDHGIFNIEGGCYAKCIQLSKEKEPDIFSAIRYGTLLENVVVDSASRQVNFDDASITENTRASYPIEYVSNAKIPCEGPQPKNIVFLTADAFGVLPPVSRLSAEQAMYHFISGYTAKVAGTEMGVTEPQATFSSCFGAAFMVWHPSKYAELLSQRMQKFGCQAWLVNTGWTGGPYGVGKRMSLKDTRAILDAIHDGTISQAEFHKDPVFGLMVPSKVNQVSATLLNPRTTWSSGAEYDQTARKLAELFRENFKKFESGCSALVREAGPIV
jgi:phosphoenolpyruvate carboxykinase (ATP)